MSDTTDSILGGVTAGFLALCCVGALANAWCRTRRLKMSRSDTDLENLQDIVQDSLPTH